ncbi:hypothetical protein [Curtobacterium sp. MCBA15_016]|uniref:hypothetical protein n=1 Tax=Curtobacterium sp. MCBA15_016 TaxID=1898740 RepID=UPI001C317300|nr:hypothetical protein [Curtobacterium sp. MCBA15_016]
MTTTSGSSPTNQEQDGTTATAVLELGKLLAAELEQTDTLGRWIAHYLAERMISLEKKTGSERGVAEAEIADLILRLWSLRRRLPGGRLPLAEVDKVEAAVERLAPGRRPWAYFGAFAADTEPSAEETETSTTLKAALLVDRLAGDLVHGLIGRAASLAEEDAAAWTKQAEKIGDGALRTLRRIRFAANGGEDDAESMNWISEVTRRATALSSAVSTLVAALDAEGQELPGAGRG